MKKYLSYSLILATAATGLAHGAATAYTTPVGYSTVAVVPVNSDTPMSVPLQRAAVWAGASTGVLDDTVSVAASSYTANQFGVGTHMLQVTSGLLIGRTFPVLSNGTSNVTVDPVGAQTLRVQGFMAGDKFVLRPYWTLDTLFPQGDGIGKNADPDAPTNLILLNSNEASGVDRAAVSQNIYYDGVAGGTARWINLGNPSAIVGNLPIRPSTVLTARNLTSSPLSIVNTGEVPSVPAATLVVSNTVATDNLAQLPYPVDTTLQQSGLVTSGALTPSSDPDSPTDVLFTWDPASTGLDPGASKQYIYYDGLAGGAARWIDLGAPASIITAPVLKAGSYIAIRKAAAGDFTANTWVAPLPYAL
jgi:uncharacterized protein (TIGR02597 family)